MVRSPTASGTASACPSAPSAVSSGSPPRSRTLPTSTSCTAGSRPGETDDPDAEALTVFFCPRLIAEQTRFLLDADYRAYLDIIEWSICLHITFAELAWPDRESMIDKALWDKAPESMTLQNRVQMRILDDLT